MTEEIKLEHLKCINLEPGDVLVLTVDNPVDMERQACIKAVFDDVFPGHKCIVLHRAELGIIRPTADYDTSPSIVNLRETNSPDYIGRLEIPGGADTIRTATL